MKLKTPLLITALTLFAAIVLPLALAAENSPARSQSKHHHYRLIDLGTLGGPVSSSALLALMGNSSPVAWSTSTEQLWAGPILRVPTLFLRFASLTVSLTHAFRWRNGARTDLGALDRRHKQRSELDQRKWSHRRSSLKMARPILCPGSSRGSCGLVGTLATDY